MGERHVEQGSQADLYLAVILFVRILYEADKLCAAGHADVFPIALVVLVSYFPIRTEKRPTRTIGTRMTAMRPAWYDV